MKYGRSLTELAAELERQNEVSRDFRAPARKVSMTIDKEDVVNPRLSLRVDQMGNFGIKEHAHDQLGGYLKIPAAYYNRMRVEDPDLLAYNVNNWLAKSDDQQLIRTLDNEVRGWLSNRYRVIDNLTVATSVIPVLMAKGTDLTIESCEVTEQRMYIKAVNKRLTVNVKKGQPVQSGIVISNSEVGCGAFKIEALVLILACINGAIMPDSGLKKYHIGRHTQELENAIEVFADDTRAADDQALMLKMRDVVKAALDEAAFRQTAKLLTITTGNKIEKDPIEAVDAVIEVLKIGSQHKSKILTELLRKNDLTQWGLSNAVTAVAQSVESYEEATQLERVGGEIFTLGKREWAQIAA